MKLVAAKYRTESDAEEKILPSPTPTKLARLDFEQYIVEEMVAVSMMELLSFRIILSKIHILQSGCPPSDRKTFLSYGASQVMSWSNLKVIVVV